MALGMYPINFMASLWSQRLDQPAFRAIGSACVQRQLDFPSILPQAKILLSKVGGSSRFTGSNDGLYIRIEISNQARAFFYIT